MQTNRISIQRTVLYDEETGQMCCCEGNFWKTCSLRVASDLPCTEAIVSITPIERGETDPAENTLRSLDVTLAKLTDSLRHIGKRPKI